MTAQPKGIDADSHDRLVDAVAGFEAARPLIVFDEDARREWSRLAIRLERAAARIRVDIGESL